jgi:hypothetical protein
MSSRRRDGIFSNSAAPSLYRDFPEAAKLIKRNVIRDLSLTRPPLSVSRCLPIDHPFSNPLRRVQPSRERAKVTIFFLLFMHYYSLDWVYIPSRVAFSSRRLANEWADQQPTKSQAPFLVKGRRNLSRPTSLLPLSYKRLHTAISQVLHRNPKGYPWKVGKRSSDKSPPRSATFLSEQ